MFSSSLDCLLFWWEWLGPQILKITLLNYYNYKVCVDLVELLIWSSLCICCHLLSLIWCGCKLSVFFYYLFIFSSFLFGLQLHQWWPDGSLQTYCVILAVQVVILFLFLTCSVLVAFVSVVFCIFISLSCWLNECSNDCISAVCKSCSCLVSLFLTSHL